MINFDLEERTERLGESVIELAKKIPRDAVTISLISQLVRAGTSVGANYREANNACSRRDFVNRITYCKKESSETKYWLSLIAKAVKAVEGEAKNNAKEAQELTLIFASIIVSCKKGQIKH